MIELDEIVRDFLTEAKEGLDQLDRDLVALEARPADRELLAQIFRAVHTIKGTCGFLDFRKLERLTHAGENLLARLRDGELALTAELTSGLLAMVDAIRAMLVAIEATGSDGDADFAPLVAELARLLEGRPRAAAPALASSAPAPAAEPAAARNESIRVSVALIDRLMNQVGELVLARNEILQCARSDTDPARAATTQRLNLITSELQEGVMQMRMQPIDAVLSKFPRLVRDVAKDLGKRVRLEMDGRHTELDKTLIEAIRDPLTHLLRNAIDHGIERPAERSARGKPEEGRIGLRARHESGRVIIEVSDDGGGIQVAQIRARAIAQGLLPAADAELLSERQLLELVFLPGLSTAETVTKVSGRGVGMDVVKTNVEKLCGEIEIQSQPGRGTTVRIRIPLTLAIVPALVVAAGGLRFAIPQANLVEVVRAAGDRSHARVEDLGGAPVFRLRGQLLPLVQLSRVLESEPEREPRERPLDMVVLECDGRRFGLGVDAVIDSQEIVVKPLGAQLKGIAAYSGATILGDGQVALILDVPGLAQQARALSEQRPRGDAGSAAPAQEVRRDRQPLLLVRQPDDSRLLIPLDSVARLERLRESAVEQVGASGAVQHRGRILPLVRIGELLPERRALPRRPAADADPQDGALSVVVVESDGLRVGLVIGEILDVVEQSLELELAPTRAGVRGSLIVAGRITELLDLAWVLEQSRVPPQPGLAA